ncbi:MAG TPA: glycosyltransferase 87 family protein [Solirubrobacteraceae bacterium]
MSVATQGVRGAPRVRSGWWRPALATALALVAVAATAEIVLDGAAGRSPLIPKSPPIAGWLSGIGERLGYRVFLIAILSFAAAYGAMLLLARRPTISKRWAIVLIAVLHAIVFAGPILISTDVFSYIAYARMGVEHGINPYLHGPVSISHDPIFQYVGHDWRHVATAYGPLYTLLSYPFAPLGVEGALWGMKILAQLASLATLALTWRCARARKLDPVWAILAVGANPLYVIYGVGGAHNDLLMLALMMTAVSLTLARRDAAAGAVVVAGALVKATIAALLPFMILSRRRLAPILGALAALGAGALIAWIAFGVHGIDVVAALNRDAAFVSTDSFATEIAHLFGKPGVFPVDHALLKAALVLIVLHLMWRTWRGYDWIAASGWTLLAISVTSTWLLAWYILWPLPLAVVTRDRRLVAATLAVQLLFILHQTSPLFAPVQ